MRMKADPWWYVPLIILAFGFAIVALSERDLGFALFAIAVAGLGLGTFVWHLRHRED
jgi:hypothetical protein